MCSATSSDDKSPRSVVTEIWEMAMERYEVHGVKVYQLDICEAIHDHDLCPGITSLRAGDIDLGRAGGRPLDLLTQAGRGKA